MSDDRGINPALRRWGRVSQVAQQTEYHVDEDQEPGSEQRKHDSQMLHGRRVRSAGVTSI